MAAHKVGDRVRSNVDTQGLRHWQALRERCRLAAYSGSATCRVRPEDARELEIGNGNGHLVFARAQDLRSRGSDMFRGPRGTSDQTCAACRSEAQTMQARSERGPALGGDESCGSFGVSCASRRPAAFSAPARVIAYISPRAPS